MYNSYIKIFLNFFYKRSWIFIFSLLIFFWLPKEANAFTNGFGGSATVNEPYPGAGYPQFNATITWDGIGDPQSEFPNPGDTATLSLWIWHCNEANGNPCDSSTGGSIGLLADFPIINTGVLPTSSRSWGYGLNGFNNEYCGRWQIDIGVRGAPGVVLGNVYSTGVNCGGGGGSCGNGSCDNGETCSTCYSDCGTCPGSGCGDGSCNGSETCSSCPGDCGGCIITGRYKVEALKMNPDGSQVTFNTANGGPVNSFEIVAFELNPRKYYQSCMTNGLLDLPIRTGGNPCTRFDAPTVYSTKWYKEVIVNSKRYRVVATNARCGNNATKTCTDSSCTSTYCDQITNIASSSDGYNSYAVYKLDTCSLNLTPSTATFAQGTNYPFSANVNLGLGFTLNRMNFSSNNTAIAAVFPTSISNPSNPSSTSVTGVSAGTASVGAIATISSGATTATCSDTSTTTITNSPGCSLSLTPATRTFAEGANYPFSANVTVSPGFTLNRMNFSSSNTAIATVNPASISYPSNPSSTSVTGVSAGTATLTATGRVNFGTINKTCSDTSTATITTSPGCSLSLTPATRTFAEGANYPFSANVTVSPGFTLNQMNFSSSNTAIATVNPALISSPPNPSSTSVTGVSGGTATLTATGRVNYGATTRTCNDTSTAIITADPWWQVLGGGDVISYDTVSSQVPLADSFMPDPAPFGVPIYEVDYDFKDGLTKGSPSSKNWLVNSLITPKVVDYAYFNSLVPTTVPVDNVGSLPSGTETINGTDLTTTTKGILVNGYRWYRQNGNLTISSAVDYKTTGNQKVILIVNGSVTINGNITLDKGTDFFMVIANSNIIIDPNVTGLAGLYLTPFQFKTGTKYSLPTVDSQLNITGSVVGWGTTTDGVGILLQRNLGDANNLTTPGEKFNFAPDLLINFPQDLIREVVSWKEAIP